MWPRKIMPQLQIRLIGLDPWRSLTCVLRPAAAALTVCEHSVVVCSVCTTILHSCVLAGGIVDYYLGQPVTLADCSLRGMVKNTVQYCSGGGGGGSE